MEKNNIGHLRYRLGSRNNNKKISTEERRVDEGEMEIRRTEKRREKKIMKHLRKRKKDSKKRTKNKETAVQKKRRKRLTITEKERETNNIALW